jgi:anti-anti-sigma factor
MSEFRISPLETGNGLKVAGELDVATAPRFRDALVDMASQPELVLDLSEVTFLDSFGLHSILALSEARNGNGPVVIRASDVVARLLRTLALHEHPGLELQSKLEAA